MDSLCNPSELEECDSLTEDTAFMVRIDLRDGQTSQKVSVDKSAIVFEFFISGFDYNITPVEI